MRGFQFILGILGRICLSLIFIISAINKIFDWAATEKGLVNVLCDWHTYLGYSESLQVCFSNVMPWAPAILVIATAVELLGGLLVLFGVKTRFGAFLLIILLIPVTILFHQFWYLEGGKRDLQIVMFLKNLAILGGLLYVLAYGNRIKDKNNPKPHVENPDLRDE